MASEGLHSAAYSQADQQLSRRIRVLDERVAEIARAVARLADAMSATIAALAPCPECRQVGTHLGTCSRSVMRSGMATITSLAFNPIEPPRPAA